VFAEGRGMRTPSLTAAVVLAFLCVLPASCLQGNPEADAPASPTPSTGEPSTAEHVGEAPEPMLWGGKTYGLEDFPFKVEKEWDGEDKAGGRQRALALLEFEICRGVFLRRTYLWNCPLDVTMPVQTESVGRITPKRAAAVSAEVANLAVTAVMESREDWQGQSGVFCNELKDTMNKIFRDEHRGYGARVTRWLR
jgi:hypothetical protein